MFRVDNADFIADKLASELLPLQEYREVFKNAEEAIRRRIDLELRPGSGRLEFDVDWALHRGTGDWFASCADNGDGMTRPQIEHYTTTLAVRGAGSSPSITGNQGMGLKIAGPTRHKRGVLIRSLKNGERWMVQIGWDGTQYGLIPLGPNGELIVPVAEEMFPDFINENGSGTVVTFLGNDVGDNTFAPPDRPRGWLFKYMHTRFFRLSEGDVDVIVRVPSGDPEDWPHTKKEADRKRKDKPSFNLSRVWGTAAIWQKAAVTQADDYFDAVEVPGDPAADIPAARVHWWVLPAGTGTDVTSRTNNGGSIAVLFQNELHDWRIGGQANPYFARMGVLFGKTRVAFVLEPLGSTIASDFARAHVLVGGRPVFESDAWLLWADQFRAQLPDAIKRTMLEEQARLQTEDPERARRIRERLKDIVQLLRPRRFRRQPDGAARAGGPAVTGGDGSGGVVIERLPGPGKRRGASATRGIGSVLTQVDETSGEPADEVYAILRIEPRWVTEAEADDFAIVNGNGSGLHDRAAALAGEDGVSATILLLNREFRGYQAILAAVNEWANPEGDDDKAKFIENSAQEWTEQKMVEAVTGLRQLENGSTWVPSNFNDAFSPVALTAAFMADRYHTLREVKRQVGSVRAQPATTTASV